VRWNRWHVGCASGHHVAHPAAPRACHPLVRRRRGGLRELGCHELPRRRRRLARGIHACTRRRGRLLRHRLGPLLSVRRPLGRLGGQREPVRRQRPVRWMDRKRPRRSWVPRHHDGPGRSGRRLLRLPSARWRRGRQRRGRSGRHVPRGPAFDRIVVQCGAQLLLLRRRRALRLQLGAMGVWRLDELLRGRRRRLKTQSLEPAKPGPHRELEPEALLHGAASVPLGRMRQMWNRSLALAWK